MKNIIALFLLALAGSLSAQWTEHTTLTDISSQKFNFISDNVGYSLGTTGNEIKVLKTLDGGSSWNEIDINGLTQGISDFHFYEDGHGILLQNISGNPTQPIQVYQTINDGASWQNITPDSTNNGNWGGAVHFVNDNVGFFGANNILYKTVDGGLNWTEYNTNGTQQGFLSYSIQDVHFYDENNGIMGFWDNSFFYGGAMYVTSNGGDTWKQTFIPKVGTVTGKVIHSSETTAYAAPVKWGSYDYLEIYKTVNSGATWDTIFAPDTIPGSSIADFDFYDENNGIIVVEVSFGADYVLYNTFDGGESWHHCGNITDYGYQDVELTSNSGFITGDFESFFKLNQGYSTSIFENTRESISIYPNPNRSRGMLSLNNRNNFERIKIIDINGKTIFESSLLDTFIQLPNLSPGIYQILFTNDVTIETTQLVIE